MDVSHLYSKRILALIQMKAKGNFKVNSGIGLMDLFSF
jgi:hypothetical protein